MSPFEFEDYKQLVLALIEKNPGGRRGQFQRISEHLGVHSSMISQIFKGPKDLSLEHACLLADFFGFNDLEEQYFVTLVQFQRAGNQSLSKFSRKRLNELKAKSQAVANRVNRAQHLTEAEQATFYSNWHYAGMRLLSEIPGHQTVDEIARYFRFPKAKAREIVSFLLKAGLCKEDSNGKLTIGAASTHIGSHSPLVARHHINWRLKVCERLPRISSEELAFTSPMTVAKEDFPKLRAMLIDFISQFDKKTDNTRAEILTCFNLDFVKIED